MKIALTVLSTAAGIILASCSGSNSAKTRAEKETEFERAFGFPPPSEIVSIEHFSRYQRRAIYGDWTWMRFTYDAATYRKILSSGYKSTGTNSMSTSLESPPTGDASLAWWPKRVVGAAFTRTDDDTTAVEGFSFEEYLWYDESTGYVYFHKTYWD